METYVKQSVVVIGAGAAGLASLRHLTYGEYKNIFNCYAFEQTGSVGGTWVYTEKVGNDEYGLPIHSSMYKSLRTNLPKEVMSFPDFPLKEDDASYVPASYMLQYLKDYANHFDLLKYIQFHHHVLDVSRDGDTWRVKVKDLKTKEIKNIACDGVMVCNGHYNTPFIPQIKGQEKFKGHMMHSHDYRTPNDFFQNKNVVVIGAGPSGIDLAVEIASCAKMVYISHHSKDEIKSIFPENVRMKPDIIEITGPNELSFADQTVEHIDTIFYCTGYKYNFPFLSNSCKVSVEDNCVYPLYKHLLSIEYPSLCFIGLPFYVCAFAMFDLQARFYVKAMRNGFQLPNKLQMYRDTEQEMLIRSSEYNLNKRKFHMMGPLQEIYYENLSNRGELEKIPRVMTLLHNESSQRFLDDIVNYRKDRYKLIDSENFVKLE